MENIDIIDISKKAKKAFLKTMYIDNDKKNKATKNISYLTSGSYIAKTNNTTEKKKKK